MKAMILAAGLGTRMRPLTDHCPKPLLDVGGEPLIVRHLCRLADAGFRDIVINISHLGQLIEQHLGDGGAYGVRIAWSLEPQPLETAGGIANALPLLGDAPFLVLNGDIWCERDLGRWDGTVPDGQRTLAHLVLVDNPEHHPRGDFVLHGGLARPRGEDTGYTFSGLSLLHPRLFDGWRSRAGSAFPLRDVLLPAMAAGCVSGEHYPGYWLDVGTPARLEALREKLGRHPPPQAFR